MSLNGDEDNWLSLDDNDKDNEPPLAKKQAVLATTTQPFKVSISGSDVEMVTNPLLPLPKKIPAPALKSDDEDSEDDLTWPALAKGKHKATQARKRKS